MYNLKTVAANIKAARLRRNYSQDYIAYKIGVSQNGYSKIELGYTNVTLEKVAKIAEVLEVDLARLIEGHSIEADVEAINRMAVVPQLLEIVCRVTGMGFAAVARVTENKWVACGVHDDIAFGLKPGGELKLETTICHEIRQNGRAVIIDNVAHDKTYVNHHTPALYGFLSYISVPIITQDGDFWGTLCAIDPEPHKIDTPEIIDMFKLFAGLISSHLNADGFYKNNPSQAKKARRIVDEYMVIASKLPGAKSA